MDEIDFLFKKIKRNIDQMEFEYKKGNAHEVEENTDQLIKAVASLDKKIKNQLYGASDD